MHRKYQQCSMCRSKGADEIKDGLYVVVLGVKCTDKQADGQILKQHGNVSSQVQGQEAPNDHDNYEQ